MMSKTNGQVTDVLRLLDREPPADYLREWTARIAAEKEASEAGKESVLIFRLGEEWLALPTRSVEEVTDIQTMHAIPRRQSGVIIGLVGVRGELLICASLAQLLGLDIPAVIRSGRLQGPYQRLMVVSHGGTRQAFPVSEIHGIYRYQPHDLKEVPQTLSNAPAPFTYGILSWQEKSVGCLDEGLLFHTLNKSYA